MATSAGFQERIAAFARQLSEEMSEIDASKGVCWLDSIEHQAIEITNAVHAELLKQRSNDYPTQDGESVGPKCGRLGQYKGKREVLAEGCRTVAAASGRPHPRNHHLRLLLGPAPQPTENYTTLSIGCLRITNRDLHPAVGLLMGTCSLLPVHFD